MVLPFPKSSALLASRSLIVYFLTMGSLAPGSFNDTVNDPINTVSVMVTEGIGEVPPPPAAPALPVCPRVQSSPGRGPASETCRPSSPGPCNCRAAAGPLVLQRP